MPHLARSDSRQLAIPWTGRPPASRHASYTGACCAVKTWAWKQSVYLQVLEAAGALTDQAMAGLLGWPLSSVNSTRNAVAHLLTTDGFDVAVWSGGRTTKRTRWRIR